LLPDCWRLRRQANAATGFAGPNVGRTAFRGARPASGFINAGRTVFGDLLEFDIPCLKIKFKPKEKS